MSTQRLIPNQLAPVVAPTHALKTPKQLEKQTLLHSLARPDDWDLWLKSAGVSGVDAQRGMRYETSLLAYQAAIEGHGVAIAQKALVEKELAEGTLVIPFGPLLDRGAHTYYFAWPSGKRQTAALRAFREWLATVIND